MQEMGNKGMACNRNLIVIIFERACLTIFSTERSDNKEKEGSGRKSLGGFDEKDFEDYDKVE